MDINYEKFYELGNGGQLIFERDLEELTEHLGRPHAEFFGAQLQDQEGDDMQWLVVASLRGKVEPPTSEGIQFTLRENNWLDGLAKAVQEALARLYGHCINQIKGTRFEYYPRRDAMGQPLEAPYHPQLRRQVEDLSFMMYDRQKELDNARAVSNHKSALVVQRNNTITRLLKDRKKNRRRLDKKQRLIARLRHKISELEEALHEKDIEETEDEGEDIAGDPYSYLSNDDDFLEDYEMDFFTDTDDSNFINDEDEEEEPTESDE